MRIVIALLLGVLSSGPALSGPWPRAEGSTFVALSFTGSVDVDDLAANEIELAPYGSFFLEHGLTPRLTLGLDGGGAPKRNRKLLAFARYPIGRNAGKTIIAIKAGLGVLDRGSGAGPLAAIGVDIGRGMATPLGNGWLALDTWLEYRTAGQDVVLKADLTAGLSVSERMKIMVQLQGRAVPNGDPSLRIAPSLAYRINEEFTLELGLQAGAIGDRTLGFKLGTWIEF